jgi:hypothetical protein
LSNTDIRSVTLQSSAIAILTTVSRFGNLKPRSISLSASAECQRVRRSIAASDPAPNGCHEPSDQTAHPRPSAASTKGAQPCSNPTPSTASATSSYIRARTSASLRRRPSRLDPRRDDRRHRLQRSRADDHPARQVVLARRTDVQSPRNLAPRRHRTSRRRRRHPPPTPSAPPSSASASPTTTSPCSNTRSNSTAPP